jgi:hypothetical protein
MVFYLLRELVRGEVLATGVQQCVFGEEVHTVLDALPEVQSIPDSMRGDVTE